MSTIKQQTEYDCGVATVTVLLQMFMKKVPQNLREMLNLNEDWGVCPDTMKEVVEKLGFIIVDKSHFGIALVNDDLFYGEPCECEQNGHYCFFIYVEGKCVVHDVYLGEVRQYTDFDELIKLTSNVRVKDKVYNDWVLHLKRKES